MLCLIYSWKKKIDRAEIELRLDFVLDDWCVCVCDVWGMWSMISFGAVKWNLGGFVCHGVLEL